MQIPVVAYLEPNAQERTELLALMREMNERCSEMSEWAHANPEASISDITRHLYAEAKIAPALVGDCVIQVFTTRSADRSKPHVFGKFDGVYLRKRSANVSKKRASIRALRRRIKIPYHFAVETDGKLVEQHKYTSLLQFINGQLVLLLLVEVQGYRPDLVERLMCYAKGKS